MVSTSQLKLRPIHAPLREYVIVMLGPWGDKLSTNWRDMEIMTMGAIILGYNRDQLSHLLDGIGPRTKRRNAVRYLKSYTQLGYDMAVNIYDRIRER